MGTKVFSSAVNFLPVTPSDTTSVSCKGIYVGGTGTVVVAAGPTATPVSFVGVPTGTCLPIELKDGRIMAATTATNIVQLGW